jgi:hypothetical protein
VVQQLQVAGLAAQRPRVTEQFAGKKGEQQSPQAKKKLRRTYTWLASDAGAAVGAADGGSEAAAGEGVAVGAAAAAIGEPTTPLAKRK